MRSLTARYNTDWRNLGESDWVVDRQRSVDRRRPTKTHVRAQRAHPPGGMVTRDLCDIGGTPAFCPGCFNPKSCVEEVNDTVDHVLLAHLDLDYGIGRLAIPTSEKRALTLEEACQPCAITRFLGCALESEWIRCSHGNGRDMREGRITICSRSPA